MAKKAAESTPHRVLLPQSQTYPPTSEAQGAV